MNYSPACVALVKEFEGCRLVVGHDTNGTPVVGYGHDDYALTIGATITQEDAEKFLADDLQDVEQFLNRVITRELRQGQFDALCDFVYNIGSEKFYRSKLFGFVNDGRDDLAMSDLLLFCHDSNGVRLTGLYNRRVAEKALYQNV
jgi:lysozyme